MAGTVSPACRTERQNNVATFRETDKAQNPSARARQRADNIRTALKVSGHRLYLFILFQILLPLSWEALLEWTYIKKGEKKARVRILHIIIEMTHSFDRNKWLPGTRKDENTFVYKSHGCELCFKRHSCAGGPRLGYLACTFPSLKAR